MARLGGEEAEGHGSEEEDGGVDGGVGGVGEVVLLKRFSKGGEDRKYDPSDTAVVVVVVVSCATPS